MRKSKRNARPITELLTAVTTKLRPPFSVALGSPGEVAELSAALPDGPVTCWQMDLFQADRLTEALRLRDRAAVVETRADFWDISQSYQTILYPVAYGGERALKLDVIEQSYHQLKPQGTLVVLSPYEKDDFFAGALKKVFGRVHAPMNGDNQVFWCQRGDDRPRRRHEMNYHVRVDAETSYSFLSRPGVFGYGFYDEGARALMEATELTPGQRVLDLGCGVGTNGILAARHIGPDGHVTFVDSNVRAIDLAEINAKALGVTNYRTVASHTLTELADASFDVVLANPPYYGQGAIVHHFVERSHTVLRPGGVLYLVTKQVDVVWPMIQERFTEPELFENRGYVIFRAVKTVQDSTMSAEELIRHLGLQPHPKEGGFFRETYRAAETFAPLPDRYQGQRCASTAIYYLLTPNTYSALHRLQTDEIFHFYLGDPVRMLQLDANGQGRTLVLGPDVMNGQQLQVVVPRGVWQGSCLEPGGEFALLGCTVAPGFEYEDYVSGDRQTLTNQYPTHGDLIRRLTPS